MDEIIGRFRGYAVEAAEASAEFKGEARAYIRCAEEVRQIASPKTVISATTAPPASAQAKQEQTGKKTSRRAKAKAAHMDIQGPTYSLLREEGRLLDREDILAKLQSRGLQIEMEQLMTVLRRGVREAELVNSGSMYGPGRIVA